MKTSAFFFFAFLLGLPLCSITLAQTSPSASAATQPTPHKAEIPEGFHALTVGDRTALCVGSDDDWIKTALASVKPATRPSTMPSDVIANVNANRSELVRQMQEDLGITDPKSIDTLIDGSLLPMLNNIQNIRPTIYYLVCTRQTLADRMEKGWADPHYRYLRFARDVAYSPMAALSPDHPVDDTVWWVEIHEGDNVATRTDALNEQITTFESALIEHLSGYSRNLTDHTFEKFIHSTVFAPLKFSPGVQWFDFGVSNIYAIKYASLLTGTPRQDWTQGLVGPPGKPGPWASLDLQHLLDPKQIRPEYLSAYAQALLPKGALVIQNWITQGGDGVFAKTLPTLKSHTPATADELIKAVKDSTQIDLTPWMKPQ